LLRPNYNNENIEKYKEQDKYKKITYSDILEVVEEHKSSLPYYDEFKSVLKKHSNGFDNELYEILEAKFINMIKSKKKS
jgi:hypothetical protein